MKRVLAEDVTSTAEASWATIIGLAGKEDRVLFAGVGGDKADVMFLTSSRANRFAATSVKPQATPSAKGVAAILHIAPLPVIPYLPNEKDSRAQRKKKQIMMIAVITVIIILLLLVHFLFSPLDVLWFKGLRKMDTIVGE